MCATHFHNLKGIQDLLIRNALHGRRQPNPKNLDTPWQVEPFPTRGVSGLDSLIEGEI